MLICPRLNLLPPFFLANFAQNLHIYRQKLENAKQNPANYQLCAYSFSQEFSLFYIYLTCFVICSIDETEERLRQRPSREEDIEAIQQLQHTVMEQDMLCKRLNDERKHYRKELVNREENFNKMFNASPNVGVLDPIGINKVSNFKLSCFRCVS